VEYLSVADAAQALQVSPRRVRQLLADRSLPGVRIAGRWLVSPAAVEHRHRSRPASGRPLSSASAWQVLAALSRAEDEMAGLSPPLRSRARSRAAYLRRQLSEAMPEQWRTLLRRRATLHQFYGHPSVLAGIGGDLRVVLSGISAAHDHGADLMVVGAAEAYVRPSDLAGIIEHYALSPAVGAEANVWLRVVGSGADWLFRQRVAPAAVVAADLMERDGARDQAAGAKLAASL
jgi:excisionase family DNA binding protein